MAKTWTEAYRPEQGDEVRTTAITPDWGRKRTARAKIRRVYRKRVEVIYGTWGDRALVPRESCRFIRKGTLDDADRDKFAPCCG